MARLLTIAAVAALVLAAGCGQLTRKDYDVVAMGQTSDQVKQALGAPRYESPAEWTYTFDDPTDWSRITVWFGPDGKVVGKAWQNPGKPWENNREGRAP
jgi:hypothetical protein